MDISRLARDFDIEPSALEIALVDADGLLRASRQNIRPAEKKALGGVAQALEQAIDRLSEDRARERLVEAAVQDPGGPDENNLARYTAWCAARARVELALAGAQDLVAIARAAEEFKVPAGRPAYQDWGVAIGSLIDFWTRDLRRKVTISDHPDDSRGVKPSPALNFVHQCMRSLGEKKINEQACRSILKTLRKQGFDRIATESHAIEKDDPE